MTRYGSDLIVDLFQKYDIPWVTLNPGSSFRGLHDSMVNYGGNKPPMILCNHEEIAVFMAHGYARTTGKPMAAIVHDTVGLLHCTEAVYYAYLDRIPMLLLGATGPMDTSRRRPHIDWIHTTVLQAQPIRDYIKWDRQPVNAVEVVESFARAYRVTTQEPRGPVYLCYDSAFQEDPLNEDVPTPDPEKVSAGTLAHPDPSAVETLADLLTNAEMPVLLASYAGRNPSTFHHLVRLAEACGAAVIDERMRLNFPNRHALNVTDFEQKFLERADLVVAVDVKDLYGPLVRLNRLTRETEYVTSPNCKIAEIGYRDVSISKWSDEWQKLVPVDLQIIADSSVTIPMLADRVCEKVAASPAAQARVRERAAEIGKAHGTTWSKWQDDAKKDWDATPMTTARLASEIWDVVKDEDWVATSASLSSWIFKLWDFDRPDRYPGSALGTSTQIGIALGVALAHKGSGKVVVNLQPDGDLMFDAGALWIAAAQELPLLTVMYNNRAYYNDWEHQIRMAEHRGTPVDNAWIGQAIDFPAPDFAGLARSMGVHGEGPFEDPSQIGPALRRALEIVKSGKPALVDTVTRPR
jgi:acetolactate synthase-1/2/3 large subunit